MTTPQASVTHMNDISCGPEQGKNPKDLSPADVSVERYCVNGNQWCHSYYGPSQVLGYDNTFWHGGGW